ncbi:hypothetical protein MRB53_002275 [Persea americana]|uniref:Uncharacterized protein n=1 Tax=Persea americana TaxID=3435 RepID=A0ACC2MU11_PERAE|nr:hypothetical protein MRB53_002275 [Persea americana]
MVIYEIQNILKLQPSSNGGVDSSGLLSPNTETLVFELVWLFEIGEIPYRERHSIGVIANGIDKNGKPHKLRLYSIASSALGDFGDSKTWQNHSESPVRPTGFMLHSIHREVSLCVKRLVYRNDQGEIVKGVCPNFLCDLKPSAEVKITGPVGNEMLMPVDPNATIIMLATGTGIAPFRAFVWKMLFEEHDDYKWSLTSDYLQAKHMQSILVRPQPQISSISVN